MTLAEIKQSDKVFLTATDVSKVLGADAHTIRIAAHRAPERLGFPVLVMGSRVKIPRVPFLATLGFGEKV